MTDSYDRIILFPVSAPSDTVVPVQEWIIDGRIRVSVQQVVVSGEVRWSLTNYGGEDREWVVAFARFDGYLLQATGTGESVPALIKSLSVQSLDK